MNRNKDWAETERVRPERIAHAAAVRRTRYGGAISRNRLFFFGAAELQRLKNTRNVVFSLTGIAPSNPDTAEAYNYFKALEEPFDATNDAEALLGRVDYQMSGGSRLALRYSFSNNEAKNSNATGNALSDTTISAVSNNGTEKDRTNTVVGEYTSALRSNLLAEVRAQYSRESRPRDANARQPLITGTVGNVGTVSFLGENIQRDWRGQMAANMTWVAGGHSVKFGTEIQPRLGRPEVRLQPVRRVPDLRLPAATMLEVLSIGGPTPNRFDAPSATAFYLRQIGNLETEFTTDELAFFAQDSWRMTRDFTFNYGLRWEGTFNPTPAADNEFVLNALRGYEFPIGRTVDPTQIPDQLDQFGPRVGFAWNPGGSGQTVVRGYSGVYYARTPMLILLRPDEQLPRAAGQRIGAAAVYRAGRQSELDPVPPAAADRHRSEPLLAHRLSGVDAGAADAGRRRARPESQPVSGRAGPRGRSGLQEPARVPGGHGCRAGAAAEPERRGRPHLRQDRSSRAQSRPEPRRAGPASDRSGTTADFPGPAAHQPGLRAGSGIHGESPNTRHSP